MRYIIVPIEDIQIMFTQDELDGMRKNNDGTKAIIHEEILLRKREQLGMNTLPIDNGSIEWTYPVYNYNSVELNNLLNSDEWFSQEDV